MIIYVFKIAANMECCGQHDGMPWLMHRVRETSFRMLINVNKHKLDDCLFIFHVFPFFILILCMKLYSLFLSLYSYDLAL